MSSVVAVIVAPLLCALVAILGHPTAALLGWVGCLLVFGVAVPLVRLHWPRMPGAGPWEALLCRLLPYRDIPAPDGRLYLRRWFLVPRRVDPWAESHVRMWCIHKICLSDEDRDPHDHPAAFWTLCLKGGYLEQIFYRHTLYGRRLLCWRALLPGQWRRNPTGHIHRVHLVKGRLAWTLVRMDPSEGAWGFVMPDGSTMDVDSYRGRYSRQPDLDDVPTLVESRREA